MPSFRASSAALLAAVIGAVVAPRRRSGHPHVRHRGATLRRGQAEGMLDLVLSPAR